MATLITTNLKISNINPKNKIKFTLKEAQNFVNGYVELLYFPDNTMLIVNEEGIIKNLAYNHIATELTKLYFDNNPQKIYGNVIWCNQDEF